MYTGALPAVSNRETWSLSVTVTDGDGDPVDLTGATITIGVREPELLQTKKTWSTPNAELAITDAVNGVFSLDAALDAATFPAGQYEVGVIIKLASGKKRQMIVATLPIVDGVVNAS